MCFKELQLLKHLKDMNHREVKGGLKTPATLGQQVSKRSPQPAGIERTPKPRVESEQCVQNPHLKWILIQFNEHLCVCLSSSVSEVIFTDHLNWVL